MSLIENKSDGLAVGADRREFDGFEVVKRKAETYLSRRGDGRCDRTPHEVGNCRSDIFPLRLSLCCTHRLTLAEVALQVKLHIAHR
jgi:hypothetical protein